jgi:hypothetical protein
MGLYKRVFMMKAVDENGHSPVGNVKWPLDIGHTFTCRTFDRSPEEGLWGFRDGIGDYSLLSTMNPGGYYIIMSCDPRDISTKVGYAGKIKAREVVIEASTKVFDEAVAIMQHLTGKVNVMHDMNQPRRTEVLPVPSWYQIEVEPDLVVERPQPVKRVAVERPQPVAAPRKRAWYQRAAAPAVTPAIVPTQPAPTPIVPARPLPAPVFADIRAASLVPDATDAELWAMIDGRLKSSSE